MKMSNIKVVNGYDSKEVRKYINLTGDKGYCTISALHFVTGESMYNCVSYMKAFGRVYQKGMNLIQIERALRGNKKYSFNISKYGTIKEGLTINQFVRKHPLGNYYVIVNEHALAICDGVVIDCYNDLNRIIEKVWKCVLKDEG